ncbi:MAG: chemotaxis protein CheY [Candidatus Eremiobacteraeota bacterium]|jgi:AraC-like DNA-binding protein|nr:chemotaxis protein CheY [Candidatus Eremiobacteraeota bacterium]
MNGLQFLLIDRVREYIEQHYREHISLRDVAAALGYSRSHLTNLVSTATGKPLNAWIIERRIVAAQEQLTDPYATVAEVAASVGFGDTAHFSRKFKRIVGMTASEWRRKHTDVPRPEPACPKCGHAPLFPVSSSWAVAAAAS